MKKTILKVSISVTFILFALLFNSINLHAQIINEGFEEPAWLSAVANPANSSTTSGSVFIGATSANSTMTYYITNSSSSSYSTTLTSSGTGTRSTTSTRYSSTITSTGLNTSPNSGTWWYSKGNTSSDTKMVKLHSASHSWTIGSSGYLITPVIPAGIATVTCWVSPTVDFFIGANTATSKVPVLNYNSSSTTNGFTFAQQVFASGVTTLMQSYNYSALLTNEAQIGIFNKGSSNMIIDDIVITVDQGALGTVTTGTNTTPTYTSTTVSGTITNSNPVPAIVISSGVCYSATATMPDTSNSYTVDGPTAVANGNINSTINGLTPGTKYCARAYAITTAGIVYANTTTCFTTQSPKIPSVVTGSLGIASTFKDTINNNAISDSGGVVITSKGVAWSLTSGAQTISSGSNYTNDGITANSFTSFIAGLKANTTYYAKAYAVNSIGTGWGNEISFKTKDSAASIFASPDSLDFGTKLLNSGDVIKQYQLTGRKLHSANPLDSITVTAPAKGFLVSIDGVRFYPSVNVGYNHTDSSLKSTTIYVKMLSAVFGMYYYNVAVSHAGGSADVADIQNVLLNGNVVSSQTFSNVGTDFWTGYGYIEEMSNVTGQNTSMSVYVAAGNQDATVTVDIPGIPSWTPQTVTVLAHTVQEITNFPFGDGKTNAVGLPDSRLFYSGISSRAIHIFSTNGVPVSVWTYTSAKDNSAAGCMNFPTNTWNSQYTVQAFGGYSNASNPNSFFFVIAKDNNTKVTITPTADIVDSSALTIFKDNTAAYVLHPAGIPFSVTLNRGQIFTGLSTLAGTGSGISSGKAFAADLSGTKVVSDCSHKIAVFGGNGRCLVDTSTIQNPPNFQTLNATSGSDNLMQQMFPTVAWGTKYLSVPTKTMEDNYYRVYVQDSGKTKVTVNGVLLDSNTLVNKLYYQLSGKDVNNPTDLKLYDTSANHFFEIVGDNPISVTQFIVATAIAYDKNPAATSLGNNGKGDPEMIILSPIQQSINTVTVATPRFKNNGVGGNYINVVIPKEGIKSFRIFSDTASLSWTSWKHDADSAYHADTLNNLPFDPTNIFNTGYQYKIFNDFPNQLVDTGASSYVAGAAYLSSNTLIYLDSAFIPYPGDVKYAYARFKVAVGNSYTMTSDVPFNAIAYGMDAGESYGFNAGTNLKNLSNEIKGNVVNGSGPNQNTDLGALNTCLSIPFKLGVAIPFRADSLVWNFSNNANLSPNATVTTVDVAIAGIKNYKLIIDSTFATGVGDTTYYYTFRDTAGNPVSFTFAQVGQYPVNVTGYASNGAVVSSDPCDVQVGLTPSVTFPVFYINVVQGVIPNFVSNSVSCLSDTTVKFTDKSKDGLGFKLVSWKWNFGNGKTANVQNPSTGYPKHGTYNVKVLVTDSIGCYRDTSIALTIAYKATADFAITPDTVCPASPINFIDLSRKKTIGDDSVNVWKWTFSGPANGTSNVTYNDSLPFVKSFSKPELVTVTLNVTNKGGCVDNVSKTVLISPLPVASFTFPNDVCLNALATFKNQSAIADGSTLKYVWDFGDASRKDSVNKDATHSYGSYGPYNVSLTAYNAIGCTNTTTQVFDVLYSLIPLAVGQDYQEGFESQNYNTNPNYFPPVAPSGQRWHVTQSPVDAITWDRAVDIANNIVPSEGKACAWINNFAYSGNKQQDDLNTPVFGLPKYDGIYDSLLLKFDVAAKSTAAIGDTLEVLISTDCNNWQTIYKKWGADLLTIHDGSENTVGEFKVNDKKYWRTDSINITASTTLGGVFAKILQTGGNDVRFKFRSHNNNENNIYLDNINLYVLRPNGVGFNTTTIPFDTALNIRYNYPPTDLKRLTIYDMTGRLIYAKDYNNNAPRNIMLHPGYGGLQYMANGMYVVVMEYTDKKRAVFNFLKQ